MSDNNVIRAFAQAPMDEDEGRDKLIEMAEALLVRVKSGHVTAFACATLQRDNAVGTTWSIPYDQPAALLGMCDIMKARIIEDLFPA
jgi:hypothetical protein